MSSTVLVVDDDPDLVLSFPEVIGVVRRLCDAAV